MSTSSRPTTSSRRFRPIGLHPPTSTTPEEGWDPSYPPWMRTNMSRTKRTCTDSCSTSRFTPMAGSTSRFTPTLGSTSRSTPTEDPTTHTTTLGTRRGWEQVQDHPPACQVVTGYLIISYRPIVILYHDLSLSNPKGIFALLFLFFFAFLD